MNFNKEILDVLIMLHDKYSAKWTGEKLSPILIVVYEDFFST